MSRPGLPPICPEGEHPLHVKIREALGDRALAVGKLADGTPCVVVDVGSLREVASKLAELGYDHPISISAIDLPFEGKLAMDYIFVSYLNRELVGLPLHVRFEVPRDEPRVPSIADIFPYADYEERECHEMFGVWFEGNPHMGKRFLLDEDCCIDERTGKHLYPLRKDFKVPDWQIMG